MRHHAAKGAVVGLSLVMLAGCAGTRLADARKVTATGSEFETALARGYLERSGLAYSGGDYSSSDLWAERSMAAAQGNLPSPMTVGEWDLPGDQVGELTQERARLVGALDNSARTKAPVAAANAQVKFDCWMQKQAADTIAEDITVCRSGFLHAMDDVETAMAPAKVATPDSYLLFFDWDRAGIPPEAREIVRDAAANIAASDPREIVVTGFSDTSGNAKYNLALSQRRAEAVRDALIAEGVSADAITTRGRGEDVLIVPTGANKREPQNRRVRIDVQR